MWSPFLAQRAALVVLAACAVAALKLPSYITPCQRSSPEFQQCALASARAALPFILEGDRKLRTPDLTPVRVTSLEIDTPGAIRMKLKFSDVEFLGYEKSELQHLNVDLEAGKLDYVAWVPRWELTGHYDVTGQIIVLPITGSGACNITLEGVHWWSTVSFAKETQPDKAEHLRVTDIQLKSNHTHGTLHLDNLFNGEKLLGEQMNRFMNENWSELSGIVSPFLEQALADIFHQVFDGLFAKVAYDDIFPK